MTYHPCPTVKEAFDDRWLKSIAARAFPYPTMIRYMQDDLSNNAVGRVAGYGEVGPDKWFVLWLDQIFSGYVDPQ